MKVAPIAVLIAVTLSPLACSPSQRAPQSQESATAIDQDRVPTDTAGGGGSREVTEPASEPRTAEDLLRDYYRAINAHDYARAYSLWAQDGAASGKSYDAFASGFAQTVRIEIESLGPAQTTGAAGTIYADVPIQIRAVQADSTEERYAGRYILRRANDVPGATPEQLRWHIESARMRAAPSGS